MTDNPKLNQLLTGWEDVYKKGQLTLWVLLAARQKPMHMRDMKEFITGMTGGSFTVDDNSMYRALKRYQKAGLVYYRTVPNGDGPDRKEYQLTDMGARLLDEFMKRNIVGVFYNDRVKQLIKGEHIC